MHEEEHCQQIKGANPTPLLNPGEVYLEIFIFKGFYSDIIFILKLSHLKKLKYLNNKLFFFKIKKRISH